MNRPLRVILESPFAGDVTKNRVYALECLQDMFRRGEAPFASHLLYPPVMTKWTEEQRNVGINAGFAWYHAAELCAVYTDLGITPGMIRGIAKAESLGLDVDRRRIYD